jgi:hypothetical protein
MTTLEASGVRGQRNTRDGAVTRLFCGEELIGVAGVGGHTDAAAVRLGYTVES